MERLNEKIHNEKDDITKNMFSKLNKNNFNQILEYLQITDIFNYHNINTKFQKYYKDNIDVFKLYNYIKNYQSEWTTDIKSHKIKILNMMTNREDKNKIAQIFKVNEDRIMEVLRELSFYFNELEFEKIKIHMTNKMNN